MNTETTTYRGYTIRLDQDKFAPNPRTEYSNLGTMVCWHHQYTLGDEQPRVDPDRWWHGVLAQFDTDNRLDRIQDAIDSLKWVRTKFEEGHGRWEVVAQKRDTYYRLQRMAREYRTSLANNIVILPLKLLAHSGMEISCTDFDDLFDSGHVGWIYMTMGKAAEEWPTVVSSDELRKTAEGCMRAEVEEYNLYLSGQVYSAFVLDSTGRYLDSCGGLFGADRAVEWAKVAIDHLIETVET